MATHNNFKITIPKIKRIKVGQKIWYCTVHKLTKILRFNGLLGHWYTVQQIVNVALSKRTCNTSMILIVKVKYESVFMQQKLKSIIN